jgi:signal transduction histidine kinase
MTAHTPVSFLDLDPLWLRSVLHDLNAPLNLLTAIKDALINESTPPERRAAMLTRLPGAIHVLSTRIHTLSDVVRDPQALSVLEEEPVRDLGRLVQKMLPDLQEIARIRTEAYRRARAIPQVEALAFGRVPVRVCPIIFDRVIENLVVNSAEAGANKILVVVSCVDDRASIVVLDDGPGFPDVVLEGPREGLSLKECGRGIGLAGVAVNIEQSGGTLELGNLEDRADARVRICWPLSSLDELDRCEAEERALLVQLAERMIVLPEEAL